MRHRNKGRICRAADCAKQAQTKGYCQLHYSRLWAIMKASEGETHAQLMGLLLDLADRQPDPRTVITSHTWFDMDDIRSALHCIPTRLSTAIHMYYGLEGHHEMTLMEMGRYLKLSREGVRMRIIKALRGLKETMLKQNKVPLPGPEGVLLPLQESPQRKGVFPFTSGPGFPSRFP